jgi:hypothetical protein
MNECAHTIDGFCDAYGISRPLFYKLRRVGKAPPVVYVGNKPLIPVDGAKSWFLELQNQTASDAEK